MFNAIDRIPCFAIAGAVCLGAAIVNELWAAGTNLTVCAKLIAQTDDVAAVAMTLPEEMTNGVTAVNAAVDVSGCSSLPTVKVAGLPAGLKFTTKLVTTKKTTGNGKSKVTAIVTNALPNTIYGTPTKSGVYTIVATATTAGKKTASCSQTVVVRKVGEKVVKTEVALVDAMARRVTSGAAPGKVTGSGICQAGKKAMLKATASKGYVFVGWVCGRDALVASEEDDDSERRGEGAASTCVATTPTLVIDRTAKPAKSSATQTVLTDVDETTTFCANFITLEEDKANIVASVNGMALEEGRGETPRPRVIETNIWAGVYLEWPVAASALSATTVKVAGLPSGLKFDAKANRIYGAPTAASKTKKDKKTGAVAVAPSQVKVTVTTAGKSSQTYQIDTMVDPLPTWAVGTFAGPSYDCGRDALVASNGDMNDSDRRGEDTASTGDVSSTVDAESLRVTNGTVSVTIGANGKIGARQPVDGRATSFAANWFDLHDAEEEAFHATLTAKVGKEVVTNELVVRGGLVEAALPAGGTFAVTNGCIVADRFDAWQYNWKSEPWKPIAKVLDKETMTYYVMSDGSCVDVDAEALRVNAEWVPSERRGEDAVSAGAASTALGEDGVVGKVTLKFAASGTVTVAGEFAQLDADDQPVYKRDKLQTVKATGSAALVPAGDDYGLVFVYLAPKGLQPHTRCVEASWAQHIVTWEYGDVEHWYVCFKPVIYLYPETNTTCRVQLTLNGELTCTYPAYGADGWRDFVASPDGTLTFPNGGRYYCLYWEGETDAEWSFSQGHCVKGSETASFLADVLLEMGLTFREANEFIVYWLPLMQDNPYNIISFQGENYANAAKLSVDPQPDSLLRVFMAWRPSDRFVDLPAPVIVPFDRKGFTVVEWGGTKVRE